MTLVVHMQQCESKQQTPARVWYGMVHGCGMVEGAVEPVAELWYGMVW